MESATSVESLDRRRRFGRGRIGLSWCKEEAVSPYCSSSGEGGEYVAPVALAVISTAIELINPRLHAMT